MHKLTKHVLKVETSIYMTTKRTRMTISCMFSTINVMEMLPRRMLSIRFFFSSELSFLDLTSFDGVKHRFQIGRQNCNFTLTKPIVLPYAIYFKQMKYTR